MLCGQSHRLQALAEVLHEYALNQEIQGSEKTQADTYILLGKNVWPFSQASLLNKRRKM